MDKTNKVLSKAFLKTLFWKQNRHHRHGVFIHTMRVAWYTLINGDYKMLPAALMHDFGKPVVAYQKDEDIPMGEYSFTNHEEKSWEIIKDWRFVSDYTKQLVRYHYLIRDIAKHQTKDPARAEAKQKIWEKLSPEPQQDLRQFLKYDDLGKGKTKAKDES